jgi:hypothetical protein
MSVVVCVMPGSRASAAIVRAQPHKPCAPTPTRHASGLSKDKVSLAELEAELADREEVEPSWELPCALLQYRCGTGGVEGQLRGAASTQRHTKSHAYLARTHYLNTAVALSVTRRR